MGMMRSILLLFIVAVAVAKATTSSQPGATVCREYPFHPDADANILKTAIDSSNVTAIIDVLARRETNQRLKIANEYNTIYGVDLIENLRNVSTGNIKNLTVALMTRLTDYWTKELHDAISRSPIDERAIIEILYSWSESSARAIMTAYDKKYGSLESDLKGNGSQPSLRRMLASRIVAQRNHDESERNEEAANRGKSYYEIGSWTDQANKKKRDSKRLATSDAQKLNETDLNQWMDADESPLYSILANRVLSNLRLTFEIYEELSGRNIEDAIEKVFFNDNENKKGLLAFVKCIKSPFDFLADSLDASMPEDKTDERTLTRIIVARSVIDLNHVKKTFKKRFGESLEKRIDDRITSDDDYRYALLSLITPSRENCFIDHDEY